MDTLTLAAIALVALVLLGAAGVLISRRFGDRSYRMPSSLLDTSTPAPRTYSTGDLPSHEQAAIRAQLAQGNKIEAIKRLRTLTGLGLQEAKDYVDMLEANTPSQPPPPPAPAPRVPASGTQNLDEVRILAERGQKIQAIKRLRELTGMGLKEAKDYVEAMPAGAALLPPPSPPAASPSSADGLAEVQALARQGQKIQAIKRLRELTGLGLKEAKDYVEAMPATGALPLPPPSPPATKPASEASMAEVAALARQGQKIQAIKLYRELTGVGLKEAKDYVDAL